MKRRQKILIRILCAMVLVIVSCLAGSTWERYRQKQIAQKQEQIDVIAVVNMDEGVVKDGLQINYADQLMQLPGDNYVITGLNEAKLGIENGSYAAYIVIPESFSQSVTSVEEIPQKILLEYTLNQKLDEDSAKEALSDVAVFEAELNTNIAYIYLDAIMTAFHDVQDDASKIMEQDDAELLALNEVDTGALIASAERPETVRVENPAEKVDLAGYLSENRTLLDALLAEYDNSLQAGMEEFENIHSGHAEVEQAADTFFDTYGIVLSDTAANDAAILTEGMDYLMAGLAVFNEDLETDISTIENDISGLVEWQRAADETEANRQAAALAETYEEKRQALQAAWELAYDMWDGYVQEASVQQGAMLQEAWQTQVDADVPEKIIQAYKQGAEDVLQQIENGLDTEEDTLTWEELLERCAGIRTNLDTASEAYMEELGEQTSVQLSEDVLKDGTIRLEDSVDADGSPILPPTLESTPGPDDRDRGEQETPIIALEIAEGADEAAVHAMAEAMVGLFAMQEDREAINQMLQESFLKPLSEEGEMGLDRLQQVGESLSGAMDTYENSLMAYDPFRYMNDNDLETYLTEIGGNASDMLAAVEENNVQYLEYAGDVYLEMYEYAGLVEGAYSEANMETALNVEQCIGALQTSKTIANEQNISMLEGFSLLLPYTRVGSQGNPEVYEHIVNPVVAVRAGSEAAYLMGAETHRRQVSTAEILEGSLLAGIVVCVLCILAGMARRSQDERNRKRQSSKLPCDK